MLSLSSPAKINLFLRVLHRRPDNYHELASLFQTIDLADTLHLKLGTQDSFFCTEEAVPADSTNLVIKAANLFREKTGIRDGLSVYLEKRIPIQAGLGGGSSNAATTLWGFNELKNRPATETQLIEWAQEIGSDVSFFLSHGTAYCTGRGEKLQPLPAFSPKYVWIVKPPVGLSTHHIYSKLKTGELEKTDPEIALKSFQTNNPHYFNDLEVPAFEMMPSLKDLKHKLYDSGFKNVLMSGSGSSFFCIGDGVVPTLPGYLSCAAQFINRKPGEWYKQQGQ